MRVSVKGRYALAAMIYLAEQREACTPIIQIAEQLDISKIYLEQVFALLKRGKLVESVKGAQGGYHLSSDAGEITVFQIMKATEAAIFEETKDTVVGKAPGLDQVLSEEVFTPLDQAVKDFLESMSLADLAKKYKDNKAGNSYMFYI